jgi:hypothetical protein
MVRSPNSTLPKIRLLQYRRVHPWKSTRVRRDEQHPIEEPAASANATRSCEICVKFYSLNKNPDPKWKPDLLQVVTEKTSLGIAL